ncbi:hypothetical protein AgCh_015579 [Apium graveolens]
MSALDHLDLEDNKVLRERSLYKMKKMVEKRRQGVALGYGEYMEIYVLKVFFSVVKASDRVVYQFYCENWPFKRSSGLTTRAIAGLKDWDFTTIKDALTLAPNKTVASDGYFVIYVTVGVYVEYVSIPKNNKYIMMIGDIINQTVITGNHSTADGLAPFNSAIFAVVGQGFVAVNITFRNTAGAVNHQEVAISDTVYALQVLKERAKNRVDDLQGMFCDLQSAGKESRTNDVALLE